MEATLVWTGMWTSIAVSGLLLVPMIVEFCKRNIPICFGLGMTLVTLYLLAPYSAGARAIIEPINNCPETLWHAVSTFIGVA